MTSNDMSQPLSSPLEISGSFGIPFLGEALQLFSEQELFYWRHFKQYNSDFKTQILGNKVVCLIGPEANEIVLKDRGEFFSSAGGWYFLKSFLGEGLLLQDGAKHQLHRKLLYPSFNHQQISSYFEKTNGTVETYIEQFWKGKSISLFTDLRKLTLFLIFQLLISNQTQEEINLICQEFFQIIEGIRTPIRVNLVGTKFRKAKQASYLLRKRIQATIYERKINQSNSRSQDILDLLISAQDTEGKYLSDNEITEHILHLLFAGYQTTAKLVGWVLVELNNHQDWQKKLREEQQSIIEQNTLEFNHLKDFNLLKNVIKEIERMYPPVYTIFRKVIKDFGYANYCIPQGWYVAISPLLTHRLNDIYVKPHQFDPNRFDVFRQEDKKHSFALIGFGGGTHQCLGKELALMQAKIILSTLLRHYQWDIKSQFSPTQPVFPTTRAENLTKAHLEVLN